VSVAGDTSLERALGTVAASRDLHADLRDLCAAGGRFAGTGSEARALDLLEERHRFGVVSFDSQGHLVAELGPNTNPQAVASKIRSIQAVYMLREVKMLK